MPNLFETDIEDIERLGPTDLTKLMHCLISNELAANNLPRTDADVSFAINIPDGGADGIVSFSSKSQLRTDHIPSPYTVFQAKSGKLDAKDFVDELFTKKSKGTKLKPRIDEALTKKGAYVLFYSKSCNGKDYRAGEMREAIRRVRPDISSPIVEIIDANRIAKWCDKHLTAMIKVAEFAKSGTYLNEFMTWNEWSGYDGVFWNDFIDSAQTTDCIARIRTFAESSSEPRHRVPFRIIGQSGLGKTRMALEAFRPPGEPEDQGGKQVLSDCVAYAPYGSEKTVKAVWDLRRRGASGTLVVDNCDQRIHEKLTTEIQHADCALNLITIDFHVKGEQLRAGEIQITRAEPKTLIEIVRAHHPDLPVDKLDEIAKGCDGYPELAVRQAASPLEEQVAAAPDLRQTMMDNIIWGRDEDRNDAKLGVLTALSLFVDVGYDNNAADETEYVAETVCAIPSRHFRDATKSFIPRVVEKVGDFVRVAPLPVAIRLAQKWYKDADRVTTAKMFSDGISARLAKARADRFAELAEMNDAQAIASSLMDPNAPFGQAEVLNTEQGSRIFRSLAEVAPGAAVATLLREFGNWTFDDLRTTFGPGRRNIVWALEKIVFHREHFRSAMRVLSRLAVAENENIGNNSTGDYIGHFQYMLSGTEANYDDRIAAADELLKEADKRFTKLAIRALGRAIIEGSGRTVGAEHQGGRTLQDFFPETYGELHAYHRNALARLASYGRQDDELGEMARKRIARGIRFVMRYTPDAVHSALLTVTESYKRAWPDAVDAVESTIRYDDKRLPDKTLDSLKAWRTLLEPQSLEEQVRLTISLSPYGNIVDDETGGYINISEQRAERFAEQVLRDRDVLRTVISLISSGEQRQAFSFGRRLAQIAETNERSDICVTILDALATATQPNQSLAMGYLSGLTEQDRVAAKHHVRRAAADKRIARFAADFTAIILPDEEDMVPLRSLLEVGTITVGSFGAFTFRPSVSRLSADFVAQYFSGFLQYGVPGAQAALQVLWMYLYGDDGTKWAACREVLRDIVLTPGIFEATERQQLEHYSLEESIKKILREPQEDTDFVIALTAEIIRICEQQTFAFSAYEVMRTAVRELLKRAQVTAWPMFREALGRRNSMTRFHLLHAFEEHRMGEGAKTALLLLTDEAIDEWLRHDPDAAATIIARHVPLFDQDDGAITMSPLISRVLADHNDNEFVLSEMSANLESFSSVGSTVPPYEARLTFVRQLVNHRSPAVSSWAQNYARSLEKRIESLRRRDEEWRNGITARLPFDFT